MATLATARLYRVGQLSEPGFNGYNSTIKAQPMKATLLTLIIAFQISTNLLAANFKPGYIIQLNNDTLKGYIKKQNEESLSKCIFFRSEQETGEIIEYHPAQIKSFGFYGNNRVYFSVEYIYRKDSIQLHDMRFGRLLYSGSTKLYKIKFPAVEQNYSYASPVFHSYVIEKDHAYYTLSQREEVTKHVEKDFAHFRGKEFHATQTVSRSCKDYIGILHFVLSDCPKIGSIIDDLAFTDKSMIGLMKKYEGQIKANDKEPN